MKTFDWQVCVAPMIDVTDRHCRFLHRLLAPQARLYTEMVTTGALEYGDVARHLQFDASEHPVALQLGGSDPVALARCAKLGQSWGYDEINLNCGCPSERVQKGSFGACLMDEPRLVADCIKAMQDAVSVPVTVKHRLGLDYNESYDYVQQFVGALYDVGCRVFIVHARNAVLKGLSPKENRDVPPLRYDVVHQLKRDFVDCIVVLNGGLQDAEQAILHRQDLDGVMLGRAAWHTPRVLSDCCTHWWPGTVIPSIEQIVQTYVEYTRREVAAGVPLRVLVRPLLSLMSGLDGAKVWRRLLSDQQALASNDPAIISDALHRQQAVAGRDR